MRIIKNISNIIEAIAGEMLNIETSLYHYINGIAQTEDDISKQDYYGYPRITDDNILNIIRAAVGYIYVSVGTDLNTFEYDLQHQLTRLESTFSSLYDNEHIILKQYQTIHAGYTTNIKVKSSQNLFELSGGDTKQLTARNRTTLNVKRQFIRDLLDTRRGRFTWIIKTIDQFDSSITSDNSEDAISRFASSIFYDSDNICIMPHNTITFTFSIQDLIGFSAIVTDHITLFKHGNPLLFDLSEFWRNHVPDDTTGNFLRNIDGKRIYECDYADLNIRPVKMRYDRDETSTDICVKCFSALWGPNYVLIGNIQDPDADYCSAMCPLCLHNSPEDKPVEMRYWRLCRVQFPRRLEDMINSMDVSEEHKLIRLEALKGVHQCKITLNDRSIDYTTIGEKYIAFDKVKDFLFTEISTRTDFKDKKICTARLIG